MSGENQLAGTLTGATITATGFAVLPNTNRSILLVILSIVLMLAGVVVIGSFIAMKISHIYYSKLA